MAPVKPKTYAEIIRKAMIQKGLKRRDLEKATDFSYEHIRKVVSGLPLMSEAFNEKVCAVLGLDADDMWEIAKREKAKHSGIGMPDPRFQEIWGHLMPSDQEKVILFAESLAAERRRLTEEAESKVRSFDQMSAAELMEQMNEIAKVLGEKVKQGEKPAVVETRTRARREAR